MKCESCKQSEAVVFVQQVLGTQAVEMHLCEACAKEKGISPSGERLDFSLTGLLKGLIDGDLGVPNDEQRACPTCGRNLQAIKRENKLGCAHCYNSFQMEIKTALRKLGVNPLHLGRVPRQKAKLGTKETTGKSLREELKSAIAMENYERAAILRDRIRTLETDGDEGGES